MPTVTPRMVNPSNLGKSRVAAGNHGCKRPLVPADEAEFLDPSTGVGLCDIQGTFGVDRHGMAVCEIAEHVTGTAKTRHDLTGGGIENVQLLVAAVHDVHVLLLRIALEYYVANRAWRDVYHGTSY